MARWRWLLACLLISGGVLAGCGGDDDGGGAAGATTTVASTTTTTSAEPTSTGEPTTTTAGFSGTVIEAKVTGDQVETASRRVRVSNPLARPPSADRRGRCSCSRSSWCSP